MGAHRGQGLLTQMLLAMKEHDIPLQKVVIQKLIYFSEYLGLRVGFRFKPFTYGPYSFDLAEALDHMVFWDSIKETPNGYEIVSPDNYPKEVDSDYSIIIDDILNSFSKAASDDFSFGNMERLGTVLYCVRTLKMLGAAITDEAIIQDFKGWKGNKYTDDEIQKTIDCLKPYLSN